MGISTVEACSVLKDESASSSTIAIVFLCFFLVFLIFDTGVSSYAIYKATKSSIEPPHSHSSPSDLERSSMIRKSAQNIGAFYDSRNSTSLSFHLRNG